MTLHLLACLPPDLLMRLRQAVGPAVELTSVDEWCELESAWLDGRGGVLVLDPRMALGAPLPAWAAGVPSVLYTALTPEAIRGALTMCGALGQNVSIAFRGHDDTPPQLRLLIDDAQLAGLSARMLHLLAPRLATTPPRGEVALGDALRHPARYRTVEALADHAGVSAQRLRRWTREAGLVSPKRLMLVGRVVWAYHYLRGRTASLSAIAAKLGYAEPRDLARHVRRATGMLPRELAGVEENRLFCALQLYLGEPARVEVRSE